MRAVVVEEFGTIPRVREVPPPEPSPDGVVVRVGATGLCRSDWHGWMGHDPDISLPHVPGHELAGTVAAVGPDVRRWRPGDRVTVPFVCGCGRCPACAAGQQQVCEQQTQPGFTHWGSFAELVAIEAADLNLVRVPDHLDLAPAAALGCRYATAFRAVVHRGAVRPGEWVAIHGLGGVGLSAVQIATAAGARVVAVDLNRDALAMAQAFGAQATVEAAGVAPGEVVAAVVEASDGGAHVSLDAVGSPATCAASILGLRRRGRHVQVGLLPASEGHPAVPMDRVIAFELDLLGSHGMPTHDYPAMLALVEAGSLRPDLLVTRHLTLEEAGPALSQMDSSVGVAVIHP